MENKEKGLVVEMEEFDLSKMNLALNTSYMDQMEPEEKKRELEVRKEVVQEYLQRAKVRQMKLKRRIDEMKLYDFAIFGSSGSSRSSSYSGSNGGRQSSYYDDTASSRTGSSASSSLQYDNESGTNTNNDVDDSWKQEDFGSSGRRRGRGRSRRGSGSRESTTSSSSYSSSPSSR